MKDAVQRVLAGDRDAFRLIVREHSLMLRSYLGSQLHHASDVDDLAQEVFIVAYRKLHWWNDSSVMTRSVTPSLPK